jgi:hypothetical protein
LVEVLCGKAGVDVHPGIVDALIRRRIELDARGWSVIGRSALLAEHSELGDAVAEDLIESDRLLRARRAALARTTGA